jgi:tetratricopeptide (TPR) repeat protein
MLVEHKINEFLHNIFPDIILDDRNSIVQAFEKYYTINGIKPRVETKGDSVTVTLDVSRISNEYNDFNHVTKLCEQEKYDLAQIKLDELIQRNPTNSEYHRVSAQIHSELGDVEKAIDSLIDALRWDSNNGWALMLMANLQVKENGDVDTAMKYYNQALVANPNDFITMNNIGANLMNLGKLDEAEKYLLQALEINKEYPNSYFALSVIRKKQNDLHSAFNLAIKAIKFNSKRDTLYQKSLE